MNQKDCGLSTASLADAKQPKQQENLIRWPEVQKRVGLCRSHAHKLISEGEFPAPVKVGARASAWIESEIDAFVDNRIAAREAKCVSRTGGE